MTAHFDVLGFGVSAVDDLLWVASYPSAGAKAPILRRERHCGGLSATALVAAARLGCTCAYAGVLGDDDASELVVRQLRQEAVDTSFTLRRKGVRPVMSTVVVDGATGGRTILCDFSGLLDLGSEWPPEGVLRRTLVLLVDNYQVGMSIRAAQVARAAGIPIVADFEDDSSPAFCRLLDLVDHLIISADFATRLTGEGAPADAVSRLVKSGRTVVVTCGENGSWYGSEMLGSVVHQPAYRVRVVDTTGCGDVFHGAYAAALVKGLEVAARVRFASAAAAACATAIGGQAGCPDVAAVERLTGERLA